MRIFNFVYGFIFLLTGCISVSLPGGKTTAAKDLSYRAPGAPFKSLKTERDHAWISERTGNTIAYLSSCNTSSEISLEQLETLALASLENIQDKTSTSLRFSERAALASQAQGYVDGVSMSLSTLVFKKNGCDYSLIYGGTNKNFSSETQIFEDFKESFRAP